MLTLETNPDHDMDGCLWAMFPLIVKDKKATFVLVSMSADSQLRKRVIEGFCHNPAYSTSPKVTANEENS